MNDFVPIKEYKKERLINSIISIIFMRKPRNPFKRRVLIGSLASALIGATAILSSLREDGPDFRNSLHSMNVSPIAAQVLVGDTHISQGYNIDTLINDACKYLDVSNDSRSSERNVIFPHYDLDSIGLNDLEAFSRLTLAMRHGDLRQRRQAEGILYNHDLTGLARILSGKDELSIPFGEHTLRIYDDGDNENDLFYVDISNNHERASSRIRLNNGPYSANDVLEGYTEGPMGVRETVYARLPYDPQNQNLTDAVIDSLH